MPSAAITYCLETLTKTCSDTAHFYHVVMVKVIGTKTHISDIEPRLCYELFEKIDFQRFMQPGEVVNGEPSHVVHNVLLDLLLWFLQSPLFAVHENVLQLLPLIAGKLRNICHDIENDICKEVVMQSYHIFEIVAEKPVGLDELIKAKVPNAVCVSATAFYYISETSRLLVHFALKRGRGIWLNGDIDGLEQFLDTYVKWINGNTKNEIVKELELLRIIVTSIDPKIHQLEAHSLWGTTLRGIIVNVLGSSPRAEQRDSTLKLAFHLVRIFDVRFVVGSGLQFLIQLVGLASREICHGLDEARKHWCLSKEGLMNECLDFLEGVIRDVQLTSKDQKARIYGPIRRIIQTVLEFLKDIDKGTELQLGHETTTVEHNEKQELKPIAGINSTDEQTEVAHTVARQENLSLQNYTHSHHIPHVILNVTPLICKWILASVEPSGKEIIEVLPYLVKIIQYTLSHLHDPLNRYVLSNTLEALGAVILARNGALKILIRECLPEVLGKYIDITWVEYRKTSKLIQDQKLKPGPELGSQDHKIGDLESANDLEVEQTVSQDQKLKPGRELGWQKHKIGNREGENDLEVEQTISQDQNLKSGHELGTQVHKTGAHFEKEKDLEVEQTRSQDQKLKPGHELGSKAHKNGEHFENEKDLEVEQTLSQLQTAQEEHIFLLGKLIGLIIVIISQDEEDHVQTHEMYPRLCNFAIASLPHLETNAENVILTFCVMTMGIMLLGSLGYADKAHESPLTGRFFASSLNLLSDVHQSAKQQHRQTKNQENSVINITSRYKELWEFCVEDLWVHAMIAMTGCIPILPSLPQCILASGWIPVMLDLLACVATDRGEGFESYYGMVLTACALCNEQCRRIIQKSNGLDIAKKFNFAELEKILK